MSPRRDRGAGGDVLEDTVQRWWYEQQGQQAGPVTAAGIGRLVGEGRLGPGHRVWRDGMPGWEPLANVAELAEALQALRGPRPPPLGAPPSFASPSTSGRSRIAAALFAMLLGGIGAHKFYLGRIGMGVVYLLFCWTFIPGIIGLIEGIVYLTQSDEAFAAKYG